MSTRPAETVRLGSICTTHRQGHTKQVRIVATHHDRDKWIGEFLVIHLCVDIDAREPTAVPGMRVVPADRIL